MPSVTKPLSWRSASPSFHVRPSLQMDVDIDRYVKYGCIKINMTVFSGHCAYYVCIWYMIYVCFFMYGYYNVQRFYIYICNSGVVWSHTCRSLGLLQLVFKFIRRTGPFQAWHSQIIPVGKEIPPHPGDTLARPSRDAASQKRQRHHLYRWVDWGCTYKDFGMVFQFFFCDTIHLDVSAVFCWPAKYPRGRCLCGQSISEVMQ